MTELKKISDYKWEVPQTGNMRVPGIILMTGINCAFSVPVIPNRVRNLKRFLALLEMTEMTERQFNDLSTPVCAFL